MPFGIGLMHLVARWNRVAWHMATWPHAHLHCLLIKRSQMFSHTNYCAGPPLLAVACDHLGKCLYRHVACAVHLIVVVPLAASCVNGKQSCACLPATYAAQAAIMLCQFDASYTVICSFYLAVNATASPAWI